MPLHRVVYVPVLVRYTSLDVEYWKIVSMSGKKKIRYAQVRPKKYLIGTHLLVRAMLAILAIIGILFLVLGILSTIYFSSLVDAVIHTEMKLYNDTRTFPMWQKPPVSPSMKVYFFNITNHERILQGEKPILQECGPYVYREIWEKVNISWQDSDSTIAYEQKKTFVFSKEESVGDLMDKIMLLNIPVVTAAAQMRYATKLTRKATSALLKTLNQGPFSTQTVQEWLWGFDHPLVKLGRELMPAENAPPFEQFGLLIGKNGSSSGVYRVFTGRTGMNKYATIADWNGKAANNFFATDACNKINGTDGTAFPPDVTPETTLELYNPELCRSIPLVFEKNVVRKGVEGMKFTPPKNIFDPPSMNPENQCYCPVDGCTLPRGVFNVSVCNYGAPIAVSFPHFYEADKSLLDEVIGLSPDQEKHEFYMDIQPKMGLGMSAKGRVQINLMVPKSEDIQQMVGVPNIVFPVFWFESGIDSLPDEISDELKFATQGVEVLKNAISYAFFAFGGLFLLAVAIVAFRHDRSQKYAAGNTELEIRNSDRTDSFARIGSGKREFAQTSPSQGELSLEMKL